MATTITFVPGLVCSHADGIDCELIAIDLADAERPTAIVSFEHGSTERTPAMRLCEVVDALREVAHVRANRDLSLGGWRAAGYDSALEMARGLVWSEIAARILAHDMEVPCGDQA